MHYEWITNAAAVREDLVAFQRSVARLAPAAGVEGHARGATDFIDSGQDLLDTTSTRATTYDATPAISATRVSSTVVRKQEYQGVIKLADLFQEIEKTAYVMIGMVQHSREGFLVAQAYLFGIFTQ